LLERDERLADELQRRVADALRALLRRHITARLARTLSGGVR
jgi:hypothetical protein